MRALGPTLLAITLLLAAGLPAGSPWLRPIDAGPVSRPAFSVSHQTVAPAPPAAQETARPPRLSQFPPGLTGDVATGQALFMGSVHPERGGPYCLVCHSVAGGDGLGGGALGDNLTDSYAEFGPDRLTSILESFTDPSTGQTFPLHEAIYGPEPLTSQEVADLIAYLQIAPSLPPVNGTLWTALATVGGFIVALILIGLFWRTRLVGVRRPMVERARRLRERR